MAHSANIAPMSAMVGFVNPESTGHKLAKARMGHVQTHFLDAGGIAKEIDHAASPFDILRLGSDKTLIYSDGGDGTVQGVVAAIAGIVPDCPERTAINLVTYREIAANLRYFAGAGGNANNWPLSAHGSFALYPEHLDKATIQLGYHRPVLYEVTNERGDIVRSNVATSGLGIGIAAIAALRLEKAKPELEQVGNIKRRLGEMAIVLDAAKHAPPFAFDLSVVADEFSHQRFADMTGFELIKSRIYAKQGRTRVNVDDTLWQPVMTHHASNSVSHALQTANTVVRMKTGRQALPAEDLSKQEMAIRIMSEQPVPFHADGETDVDSVILPGHTLHIRLAQIAIPTLIAYS
jgi:diacylglycerol kinase family enzyme